MALVQLDPNAIEILSRIVKTEKYESASDAIRHLNNQAALQKAVIHNQENEISALKDEIERLKGIMQTAGIV